MGVKKAGAKFIAKGVKQAIIKGLREEFIIAIVEIGIEIINLIKDAMMSVVRGNYKKIFEKVDKENEENNLDYKIVLKSLKKERAFYKKADNIEDKHKHECNIFFYKGQLEVMKKIKMNIKENKQFVNDIVKDTETKTKKIIKDANGTYKTAIRTVAEGGTIEHTADGIFFNDKKLELKDK